jgi:hypothetical protein
MKSILSLFIAMTLFQACQEYYTDPEIDKGEELIVIEGLITNESGPYTVKITKTLPYNLSGSESAIPEPVKNVLVTISDNTGLVEQLTEMEDGVYYTSQAGIRGEPGKTYILRLVTSDGSIYQSDSCKMGVVPSLDSVYAEPGIIKTLDKNESGVYVETNHTGIYLYMDAVTPQGTAFYYRAETRVVKESWHLEWRQGRPPVPPVTRPPLPTPVYCWELPSDNNDKNLISDNTLESKPIKKRSLGYITSDVYSSADEIRDPSYILGAITTTTIYSLSKRLYEIFTQLNTQTNPSNSIFDPIPTRIESNIACTNEPSRTVLGYFNAAAVVRKSQFFRWSDTAVIKRNLPVMNDLPTIEACASDVDPEFWINP